jgi:hypothetical protein
VKRTCCIVVLAAMIGPVGVVHADASLGISRAAATAGGCLPGCSSVASQVPAEQSLETTIGSAAWFTDALDLKSSLLTNAVPSPLTESSQPTPSKPRDEKTIRQLPASPGSSVLFLTAMLSAGLWQGVRKARSAQWANLPEWYSTSAPSQIGPMVAFDPELGFRIVAECVFETPRPAQPVLRFETWREILTRCKSQHLLLTQVPRGPPVA